jgi:amino acid transporter
MTIFAWVVGCAAGPALMSSIIIGLAQFNYPDYVYKAWHTTLIMWALILVPFIFNLWGRRLLNTFELIGGLCHFLFFIVSIVTLAVLAKRSPTDFVFDTFVQGQSGWDNSGVQWGLGLLTITYSVNGFDGVLHMSDEVKKVRTRVPRSIILATIINSVMLFAFAITLLFCIGDIIKVSKAGLPLIEVYYLATDSKVYTNILVAMPAIVIFFTVFNVFASVSRLIWVFAKDKGLPFSRQFSYVHPTLRLPLNALGLVCTISFLLAIIYIGSSTAFNAIISLQALALSVSYIPPIFFLALRRIRRRAPEPGPFTMGNWGLSVNLLALAYLVFVIIWMPLPPFLPVDKMNMNYAGPLLGAVILGAVLDWAISGRTRFQVPVPRKV